MRTQPNPFYVRKLNWFLPTTLAGWVIWALSVIGGLALVALTKGLIATVAISAVVASVTIVGWRRDRGRPSVNERPR